MQHGATYDIFSVTVPSNDKNSTILFKLTDDAFNGPAFFVEGTLTCGAKSIKARSDLFGNLIYNSEGLN